MSRPENAIRMLLLTAALEPGDLDPDYSPEEQDQACKAFDEWMDGLWTAQKASSLKAGDTIRNNIGGETKIREIKPIFDPSDNETIVEYTLISENGEVDNIEAKKLALVKTAPAEFTLINGGEHGAESEALNAAIKNRVRHTGWYANQTEETKPRNKNHQVTPIATNSERAFKLNCENSEGTIIFTHGNLLGENLTKREICRETHHPVCHIDFSKLSLHIATETVVQFIKQMKLRRIHVTGSSEIQDPAIGQKSFHVCNQALSKIECH
jgi:Circularly permutated YpsA SLOG family